MSERTSESEIKAAILEADAQVTAAILNVPEFSRAVHIANLEWRVVEAAADWRSEIMSGEEFERDKRLIAAIDALIAAREAELKEE